MANLKDIVGYILENYPESMQDELSNARVTKMVYLADWRNCLRGKGQISEIKWYFDNYGPFVWDVKKTVDKYPELFKVKEIPNRHGSLKRLFSLKGKGHDFILSKTEKQSIDHIIDVSSKKYWNDFIKLVYSTHPISSSDRYSHLNLVEKAGEYRKIRDS